MKRKYDFLKANGKKVARVETFKVKEKEIVSSEVPSTSSKNKSVVDYKSYFTIKSSGDEKCGVCNFCSKSIKMKQSNTSGLIKHLKSCQPALYLTITKNVGSTQKKIEDTFIRANVRSDYSQERD